MATVLYRARSLVWFLAPRELENSDDAEEQRCQKERHAFIDAAASTLSCPVLAPECPCMYLFPLSIYYCMYTVNFASFHA
jgi:hypothetical protein